MKKIFVGLFLAITLIFWRFYFHAPEDQTNFFKGTAKGFPYAVNFYHPLNETEKKKASLILSRAFDQVDSLYSDVSKLNALSANTVVPINEELERLFLLADRVHFLTNGLFDPTVPPALKRWKDALKLQDISPEDVELIKLSVGWSTIHFRGRVFYKEHTQTQIDIDTIIKGYFVDILAQNYQDEGFQDVSLQWGTASKSYGKQQDDGLYNSAHVQVRSPNQNWKIQNCGKSGTFCHIMDPLQWTLLKQTKESVCAVSLKLSSGTLAEGIAHTVVTLIKPDAEKLSESIKNELGEGEFQIILCEEDSTITPPHS